MAPNSLPQPVNFTRDDIDAAARAAYLKVGDDQSWQRAIARALLHLAAGRFAYDGHQVILHSASGDSVYRISTKEPMVCSCKGRAQGFKCWHIVAARLIIRAAEHHAAQQQPSCPLCGAAIEGRQYYVGGKGYTYFDVCSGDGSHYSRAA